MTEITADPDWMTGLDPGITPAVRLLHGFGIDTFSSCDGSPGHGFRYPVVLFNGDDHAGLHAVWLLNSAGIRTSRLVRTWTLAHDPGATPFWEVQVWLPGCMYTPPDDGYSRMRRNGLTPDESVTWRPETV